MSEKQRKRPEGWTDADDRALYSLLGVVDEVEVSSDFQERVVRATEEPRPAGRRLSWRPLVATAAAFLIGLTVFLSSQEQERRSGQPEPTPSTREANEVYEAMNELSELDLLALEVEELGSIHDDWFGG